MNKVMLIGRLTRDAEIREIKEREISFLKFTLAVSRYYDKQNNKTDYIPVIVWGKHAKAIEKYMLKGKLVSVIGKIQTKSYEDKNGFRRKIVEVVSNEIKFLDPKKLENVVNS
ncbi:single-stranded DNA-binding protein [Clostridium niameyense]|uniref:Single-stranded DNA-binding protein n=1 Tax=Clostridium niameyense TaxID=1622073 RepID=A0A6M0RD66_9CLOT|nr:single-stranded DNA-binding protein [Clostridium niameyense]NEZ47198.1 single-stranded DNA-binding protein [Clostridium niameyense]